VNLVLIWVQANDEVEIRKVLAKTLAVRKLNPEARELCDLYFFEMLVRIHRAGEGASYTGLKPAGCDLKPAIPAADKAIETGSVDHLVTLITSESAKGIRERFQKVTWICQKWRDSLTGPHFATLPNLLLYYWDTTALLNVFRTKSFWALPHASLFLSRHYDKENA